MFDNEIVALGRASGGSDDGKVLETIIENRKLSGSNNLWVNDVAKDTALDWSETMTDTDWIYLEGNTDGSGTGYYFPYPTTVEGKRENRTVAGRRSTPMLATRPPTTESI